MHNRKMRSVLFASAAAAALLLSVPAVAQMRTFNIQSDVATNTIPEFARQAGVQIVAPADQLAGVRTVAIEGNMDVGTALHELLQGTNLEVASDDGQVLTLRIKSKNVEAASNEAAGPGGVETVIVTAEKRSEPLQKVPMTVDTITGKALTTFGAASLIDYSAKIPDLTVETSTGQPGGVNLVVRGISATSSTSVATIIDDVPVSSSSNYANAGLSGADLSPFDIASIELLAGPQGTLYGASSLGGVLKYVLTTPDLDQMTVKLGQDVTSVENASHPGWGLRGAVNLPLIPGELAVSVSGSHEYTPGYIDNIATGQHDYNFGTHDNTRIALLWSPNDRLSVKLSALYDRSDFHGTGTILVDLPSLKPTYGYLKTYAVEPQGERTSTSVLSANVSYSFDWATLTSVTGYSTHPDDVRSDGSLSLGPLFGGNTPIVSTSKVNKFSQEMRLTSPDDLRLTWLVGGFYTDEKANFTDRVSLVDFATGDPIAYVDPATPYDPLLDTAGPSEYRESAIFGNASFKITDQFEVGGGLRYSRIFQATNEVSSGYFAGSSTPIKVDFPDDHESVWTYSGTARYHFTPDAMAYFTVSTGYQPGGVNQIGAGPPPTFGAETLTNYELGLKSQWFDKRLTINSSVYYIDFSNIQLPITGLNNLGVEVNAGKAVSKGAQLSSSFIVFDDLTLGLNAAYTDAHTITTVPAAGVLAGTPLPGSPKWAGAFTVDYTHDLGNDFVARAGASIRYLGSRYSGGSLIGALNERLPSYTTIDLATGFSWKNFDVNLYVRNLANERAYTSLLVASTGGAAILRPRTIGLSVEEHF